MNRPVEVQIIDGVEVTPDDQLYRACKYAFDIMAHDYPLHRLRDYAELMFPGRTFEPCGDDLDGCPWEDEPWGGSHNLRDQYGNDLHDLMFTADIRRGTVAERQLDSRSKSNRPSGLGRDEPQSPSDEDRELNTKKTTDKIEALETTTDERIEAACCYALRWMGCNEYCLTAQKAMGELLLPGLIFTPGDSDTDLDSTGNAWELQDQYGRDLWSLVKRAYPHWDW
jgi:hypothetical protein